MGGPEQQQHVVMLPAMAQGHLIPFLALAKQILLKFDFKITIATTPLNAGYLRTAIAKTSNPPPRISQIHLSELPYNSSDHGFPPNIENTEALTLNQIALFYQSTASLEPHFRTLIHHIAAADGGPPVCIISDVFMSWANDVAKSSGTVNVTFTTGGAYGTARTCPCGSTSPTGKPKKTSLTSPVFQIQGLSISPRCISTSELQTAPILGRNSSKLRSRTRSTPSGGFATPQRR